MDIKQNLGILAQRISHSRNSTRTFMMGLNPMPEKVNESSLIQKLVITPLCKVLSSETGANVSARSGVSPRIFWLLANGKKFAILSFPNPANGRAFIQYLNRKGQVEIRDIQTIRDYIKEFTTTKNNKDNGKE